MAPTEHQLCRIVQQRGSNSVKAKCTIDVQYSWNDGATLPAQCATKQVPKWQHEALWDLP